MATPLWPPTVSSQSLRFRLRAATRSEHEGLDALITKAGFLTDRSRYTTYLAATLAAREAIEEALNTGGAARLYPDWPRRSIVRDLRLDLEDLGGAYMPAGGLTNFTVQGRGGVLGALYVLEGASLGARVLRKAVLPLGLDEAFGARHMALQTDDSTAWPRFAGLLDASDLDASEEAECARTARRAFARFTQAYEHAQIGHDGRNEAS